LAVKLKTRDVPEDTEIYLKVRMWWEEFAGGGGVEWIYVTLDRVLCSEP
jgi:hypothetical protein